VVVSESGLANLRILTMCLVVCGAYWVGPSGVAKGGQGAMAPLGFLKIKLFIVSLWLGPPWDFFPLSSGGLAPPGIFLWLRHWLGHKHDKPKYKKSKNAKNKFPKQLEKKQRKQGSRTLNSR
jgi:hypothetical protein